MLGIILMIIGTVGWFAYGFLEFGICLMLWGIWLESVSGTTTIIRMLTPPEETMKKLKELAERFKKS